MKDRLWRHKFLVIIWVGVLGIGGYAGYLMFFKSSGNENPYVLSNSSDKEGETKAASTEEPEATQAKVGQEAADGDLKFTVSGVNCGETTIGGNQYAMDQAEGHFCRVSVSITNAGSAAVSLPESQKLVTAEGNEYKLDLAATQYAQADQTSGYWYQDIAAGGTVTGDLVFDVPAAMTPAKAVLYGADGSTGIEVTLQ